MPDHWGDPPDVPFARLYSGVFAGETKERKSTMKTKDLISELSGVFDLARKHAEADLDPEDADAAVEFMNKLQGETLGRLKTYDKVEAMAKKEIISAIKNT